MAGPGSSPSSTTAAWHFVDRAGQDHVVDRLEEVPPEYRDRALKVGSGSTPLSITTGTPMLHLDRTWDDWHTPSFVAGAGLMLVALVVVQLLRGVAGKLLGRMVMVGVVAMVLGVLYIQLLAGQVKGTGLKLQSPQLLLEDAQRARDDLNKQNTATQKMLKQTE